MTTTGFVTHENFIPEVLQYCQGAPSILVRHHLTNVIIEFCERTLCLKRDPSEFILDEDVHTYTLKYPGDRYRALDVDECRFGEGSTTQPLTKTTEKELESSYKNWRAITATKPREFFLTDDINTIRFFPTPSQDSTEDIYIKTQVTYKRDQLEFDEFLYEKWHEVIQAGTIARILMINGSSWANPRMAASFSQEYKRGLRNARKTTLTGIGEYPGRATPQSFDVMGSDNKRRSGSWI